MANNRMPLAEHDFLMLLRQGYFLMISAIEQRLAKKPTTKEKLSWWKQHGYDPIINAVDPDSRLDNSG